MSWPATLRRYDHQVEESVLTERAGRPAAAAAEAPEHPLVVTTEPSVQASVPPWAHLPYAIALAGVAGGLGWVALGSGHVRTGVLVVGVALLVAAAARLALPERLAGLLVSRRRAADVLALASLGTCLVALVLALPSPS
jgi:hypothetical protein